MGNTYRWFIVLIVMVFMIFAISACAAEPNPYANTANEGGETAGFWQGLWQGFISPFTFIISLFSKNVGVFEVLNNGNWYVFGFLLGASIIFGGSGGGAASRRCR